MHAWTRSATLLAIALFVAPALLGSIAEARAPATVYAAPYATRSEITDLAFDAQGRYGAVVVRVDLTGTPLAGTGTEGFDVYAFDLTGTGKIWEAQHRAEARTGQLPADQVVGFAATTGQTSQQPGIFFTGGPGNTISRWNTNGPTPDFDRKSQQSGTTRAVAASTDAKYVAFGVNTATNGRIFVMNGGDGSYRWDVNLSDISSISQSRVTELAFARAANLLVVGHEKGVLFLDPSATRKPTTFSTYNTNDGGAVTSLDVSNDGKFVVVGTNANDARGFVYYFARETQPTTPFNRGLGSPVTSVTASADGRYFAAGTQSGEVHFFERSADPTVIAQLREDPVTKVSKFKFQGSRGVVSVDYDATGGTLVAASALELAGFHVARNEPLWVAPGASLGLDTNLKGARINDAGNRILVASTDKVTGLKTVFGGNLTIEGGLAKSAIPGDTVRYPLKITNTGSGVDTFTVRATPRVGAWQVESVKPVTLRPDESVTLQLNITSPTEATPGSTETDVAVESEGIRSDSRLGSPVVGQAKLNVTLTRVNRVAVESDQKSFSVDQGRELAIAFTVRNLGNAQAVVNLSASQDVTSGTAWPTRFDPQQITLQPGGSGAVTLRVTAPAGAADGDVNSLTVRARLGASYQTDTVFTLRVNPEFEMDVTANRTSVVTTPGQAQTVKVTLKNIGNTADTVNLTTIIAPDTARIQWRVDLDFPTLRLDQGATKNAIVTVRATVRDADPARVTVRTVSAGTGESRDIVIQMEQDLGDDDGGGFLGIPSAGAPLVFLALFGAAAVVHRRGRREGSR